MIARVNRWLDQHSLILKSVFAIILIGSLVERARAMPFWHDEIFTVIGSQMTWSQMWRAYLDSFDLMPPLNTALTHIAFTLFGSGEIASRLPPLVAFVVTSLLIHAIVRERTNALTAWSAALLFCFTQAGRYAYEARGYALTMFGFALALFAWSRIGTSRGQRWNGVLLGFALAIGIWAHYFAVLVFLPLVAGEIARVVFNRRVNNAFVTALAVTAVLLLPLLPLIIGSAARVGTFWSRLKPPPLKEIYVFLLGTAGGSPFRAAALAILVIAIAARLFWRREDGPPRKLREDDLLAGAACLAIPAAGLVLGTSLLKGVFVDRYVLLATVGFAIVLPIGLWRIGPRNGLAEALLFGFLAVMFGRMGLQTLDRDRFVFRNPFDEQTILADALRQEGDVVVTGGVEYLLLWHYAPAAGRARMRYLADPKAELEMSGTPAIDDGYLQLQRHANVGVVTFDEFTGTPRRFRAYAFEPDWTLPRLRAMGAVIRQEATNGPASLYRVELPGR